MEIVVDPKSGKWYTVGDKGAEFVYLPKGSIVFNHLQSDAILKNGFVAGRGTALMGGTAKVSGDKVSGGIGKGQADKSHDAGSSYNKPVTGGSSSNAVQAQNKVTEAVKETKEEAEETKQTFDFIEIAINRIQTAIERVKKVAEDTFSSYSRRNKALKREIRATNTEIQAQVKARREYLKKADSVGLSKDLQKKVINGSFDITEYDEETSKLIQDFQSWYEKAMACTDAIDDLKLSLNELNKEMADNVIDEWEGKIGKTTRKIEHLESEIDKRTATSSDNYTNRQAIVASKKNIDDYQTLNKLYTKEANQKRKEYNDYKKEYDDMIKGGMDKKSKEAQEMLDNLHEMDMAARDAEKAAIDCLDNIADECVNIFDNTVEKFENKIRDLQHENDRRQNKINRRDAYASDYVGYEVGRDAAQKNISDYNELIKNNQQQVKVKQNEFNKLKARIDEFVSKGLITVGDKNYNKMMSQLQSLEDDIDSLNAGIIEFSNSISEQYARIFDSIANEFSDKLSLAQHLTNEFTTLMETAEAKGYIASTAYYKALKEQTEGNIALLQEEYDKLTEAMYNALASGEIEMYSAEWYSMKQQINGVSEEISKANKELVDFDNTMKQIEWDHFDYIQDTISHITEESDFLIDLLSHSKMFEDDGTPTSEGKATFGMHGVNYNTYMRQADEYAKELLKLDKEIAEDPYNTKLLERRNELLEKQRQSILAAEDEKEAIRDLVEEGIQLEIDHMKELIEKYKSAIEAQKDLYDYQRKIRDQVEKIASLEKQQSAYQNDDSEEGRLKLQNIMEELKNARADLEESQYEKFISDQEKLLDDLFDEYESMMNARLDNLDALVADVIANVNANAGEIRDTLYEAAGDVGYTLTDEMRSIWDAASSEISGISQVLSMYCEDFDQQTNTINTTINGVITEIGKMIAASEAQAQAEMQRVQALEKANQLKEEELAQQAQQNNLGSKDDALGAVGDEPDEPLIDDSWADLLAEQLANDEEANRLNEEKFNELENNVKPEEGEWTPEPTKKKKKKDKTVAEEPKKPTTTQGDGKIQIGDKVTFASGKYYFDSYGSRPTGNQMLGKQVYVGGINKSGSYPYALYTKKPFVDSNGLGWVKKKQISGYASGKKKIGKDSLAWTQEDGSEFIIRPEDGAVLTPLKQGDAVLNHEATERIWNMANSPENFIKDNLDTNKVNAPNLTAGSETYVQHLDKVVFNFPSVKNYEEMLSAMQHDKNFERLVSSMTIDRAAGKSSLAKYNAIRGK